MITDSLISVSLHNSDSVCTVWQRAADMNFGHPFFYYSSLLLLCSISTSTRLMGIPQCAKKNENSQLLSAKCTCVLPEYSTMAATARPFSSADTRVGLRYQKLGIPGFGFLVKLIGKESKFSSLCYGTSIKNGQKLRELK